MRKFPLLNKTAFWKNVTRFAPVWILYTLGLLALWTIGFVEDTSKYWSFVNLMAFPGVMGVINLLYALLVAQLLFGDLFNSRMCNALHALPIRRETWLVTNVVSGLAFSFFPTLVMALSMLPLLAGSMFVGAWKVPFLILLSANLEFICFYGIAVFCVMCTGNRFTMVAGYGLVNAGVAIGYWMVNTLYTPMLHGVVTPSALADELTPIMHTTEDFFTHTGYSELATAARLQNCEITDLTATWSTTGEWWRFFALAGVGIALMILAVFLYRKRDLECAGDAVAFPILRPVFQVLCSLFVMVAVQYVVRSVLYTYVPEGLNYVFLAVSLAVGWFIGKMLLERSLRVFGKQNWQGLGILAAVLALSFVGTHFDVLGIETKIPKADQVEKVILDSTELTGEADIEQALRLHGLALEEWIEDGGIYVRGYDGSLVQATLENADLFDGNQENPELVWTAYITIDYLLKNGRHMQRNYYIWPDGDAGSIVRQIQSRWEVVGSGKTYLPDGGSMNRVDYVMADPGIITVDGERLHSGDVREAAQSFLDAVKADCAAGTMIQDSSFHKGVFRSRTPEESWDGETYYPTTDNRYVRIYNGDIGWSICVYPDCENSVRWLQENGGLKDYDIDFTASEDLDWFRNLFADAETVDVLSQ